MMRLRMFISGYGNKREFRQGSLVMWDTFISKNLNNYF